VLDSGLVLWCPAPASQSGEDMAEFHVHGGRAVIAGVMAVLARLPGMRPAEPGEFTRRAVLNGRIDLTAAEAVADLVEADTARQRDQALGQLAGGLEQVYDGWCDRLVALMARLEAVIDFADDDLPDDVLAGFAGDVADLRAAMAGHLGDESRAERLREGLRVVILGAPNVGKSSLLNQLARRDAAIVSDEAGTTRDVVEVMMDVAGFPVVLADTAGLREDAGAIEAEGMRRARSRAEAADLALLVADAADWDATWPAVEPHAGDGALIVANKSDLGITPDSGAIPISARTGQGIDTLLDAMAARFEAAWTGHSAGPTRRRHRAHVEQALAALDRVDPGAEAALAAEELRLAATALGRITGRVDVEDLLDVIFSGFCIGK